MRFCIAILALFSLTGFAVADDLDDNYAALKDAQAKKDADTVKKLAIETSKSAKAEAGKPQPGDASEVDHWKQRVEFAKEVQTFAEYSLATTANAVPAKSVELVDALLEINPKSTYLDSCAATYLSALSKEGAKKYGEGAQKILNAAPNNEDALFALATGGMNGTYAARLINVMKSKAKPEGIGDADWERKKSLYLGQGYYVAGAAACNKSTWTDCDKNLRAALPLVSKEPAVAGPTYFYLGLANYNLSKLTSDRVKLQEAEKFSEQSAAIAGPMQQQAMRNVAAMKQELAAPVRR
ncbi:MAG: hypothetical protein JO307_15955 [Bryobacterales bacterium]|nr:hypothetical protein [Bryobacterales bacterium]MBV9397167.1 hypothetical protein [Bryobacterales bacterium]